MAQILKIVACKAKPLAKMSEPSVVSALATAAAPLYTSVKCIDGTCGFSDASLVKCRRFYPPGTLSTAQKLAYYSTRFGCVEVDTSTYAIPQIEHVKEWAASVRTGSCPFPLLHALLLIFYNTLLVQGLCFT